MSSNRILRACVLVAMFLSPMENVSPANSDALNQEWRWIRFDEASGLPSNIIQRVVRSSKGRVWVQTDNGLAWYDGYRWHTVMNYAATDTGISIAPDLEGGLLLTRSGRLFRAASDGFEKIPVQLSGQSVDVFNAIPLDEAGDLLITTASGRYRLRQHDSEYRLYPFVQPPTVTGAEMRTRSGEIWHLARGTTTGAFKWDGERWVKHFDDFVNEVKQDQAGILFSIAQDASVNGVWTWDGRSEGEVRRRLADQTGSPVSAMDVAPNGDAIIVYRSGRVIVRRQGVWSEMVQVPRQLHNAHALRFEHNGDLWVGNDRGLFLYRASSSRWRRTSDIPLGMSVIALLETLQGDLWVGTTQGVFVRHSNGEIDHLRTIQGTELGIVTGLVQDRQGAIWLSSGGSFTGAFRWLDGKWEHFGSEQGLHAPRIHRIVADRQGLLWFLGLSDVFGVNEPGAFMYDGKEFTPWGVSEGLPDGRVYSFREGPDGAYWFGTRGYLSRYRDAKWDHWKLGDVDRTRVFTIAIAGGRTWFGHQGGFEGLGYIDDSDEIQYLTQDNGLIDHRVWDLQVGQEGALWIGTAAGLSRYHEGEFGNFGRASGLTHSRVWPVHPTENLVYVGTAGGGLYELALDELKQHSPIVELEEPLIDNHHAIFRWRVFSYRGSPRDVETSYRIGRTPWSAWSTTRQATVLNPRPGKPTFEVRTKTLFGRVSPHSASIVLDLPPPLHRHPVVMALLLLWALTMVGAGLMVWRRRMGHLQLVEASEQRLRALVDQIPICIHELGLDGTLRTMNPAGIKMLKLECESQVIGQQMLNFVNEKDRERISQLMQRAREGEFCEFEFQCRIATGESRVFASSFVPLRDDSGNISKLMGYTQDITDRRQAEKKSKALARQLQQAQKMEAIGQLAGGVAHDFNNLLTVIGGNAAMLEQDAATPLHLQDSIQEIRKANDRATALTRQLLAFGRRQRLRPRVFNVGTVVRGVQQMLRRLISEDIHLEFVLPADVGCAEADPAQYEQMIVNLVVNARDAIRGSGTIRVAVFNRSLDVPYSTDAGIVPAGDYVVLEVSDSGIGMDEATRTKIFEPFFTTKPRGRGTGLGLATVYGIVSQSGGILIVDSEPGRGTIFSIYLQRVHQQAETPGTRVISSGDLSGTETILVAEDDPAIQKLVCRALQKYGYQVLTADNGIEAIRVSTDHPGKIDLLLTDMIMPRLNGFELAERFRRLRPDAVIIFASGYADEAVLPRNSKFRVDLKKPFAPLELVRMVRSRLDGKSDGTSEVVNGGS